MNNMIKDRLSSTVHNESKTSVAEDQELCSTSANPHEYQSQWEKLIRGTLLEWSRDPAQLEDEDIIAPTPEVIERAKIRAWKWLHEGCPPPSRIVPNGEAGISFMLYQGSLTQEIEFDEDGSIELRTFRDSRLVSREPL